MTSNERYYLLKLVMFTHQGTRANSAASLAAISHKGYRIQKFAVDSNWKMCHSEKTPDFKID